MKTVSVMILSLLGVSGCLATLSASCELFASNMVELADHAFPGVSGKHDADLSLCNNLEAQFKDGCSAVVDKLGLSGARDLANDEPATLCAHLPADAAPALLETSEGETDQSAEEGQQQDEDEDDKQQGEEQAADQGDDDAQAETAIGTEEEEQKKDETEDKAEEAQEDHEEDKDDDDDDDDDAQDSDKDAEETDGAHSAFLSVDKSQFDKDSDKMREAMKDAMMMNAMKTMQSPLAAGGGQDEFDDALDATDDEGKETSACCFGSRTPEQMEEMMGGSDAIQQIVQMPMTMLTNPDDPSALMMQLGF